MVIVEQLLNYYRLLRYKMSFFSSLSPVMQALLAGLFTCFVPLSVLKTIHQKFMDMMMGLAAGIMTAAAVWSLLVLSFGYSQSMAANRFYWLPTAVGFYCRGLNYPLY